jgi:hypothetical protein
MKTIQSVYKNKKIILKINEALRLFLQNSSYSYRIERTASREVVLDFFSYLKPQNFGLELIRIGGQSDGGYLIPDDLYGVKTCISPGVGDSIDFEKNLLEQYGIESFLADPTVDAPEGMPLGIYFNEVGIGYSSENNFIYDMNSLRRKELNFVSLEDFINQKTLENENELLLQMDIENAEYLALLSTRPEILQRFRIMVIEFHSIPEIFESKYFSEIIKPLFSKLKKYFYVAHIHANNCAVPVNFLNLQIPHAIEVTLHNNNRINVRNEKKIEKIHHELDKPCDPSKSEVYVDLELFDMK